MPLTSSASLERRYRLDVRFKLQAGGTLADKSSGFIYATYPFLVTKTSPKIIEVLHYCDGQNSVAQIARQVRLKPASVLKVLEELHSRGFVEIEANQPALVENEFPPVSIIIPVYNRPAELQRCLDALLRLDYPSAKLEIIVVDDASQDTTSQVAAAYPARLLRNDRQLGPAASRNRAVEVATHELIACVDSDCIVAPDWLRQLAPLFADEQLAAAGGATRAAFTESLLQRYEDVRSSLFMGQRPMEVRLAAMLSYLPTCNLVFRRAVFLAQGGFDPALRFGEDVDFCWRLLKAGWRIRYQPSAIVAHDYRDDWRGFLKTRLDYASSEAPLVARHPDKRRTFYLPLRALVAWLGLLIALGWRQPWPLLPGAALALLASRQKWRELRFYELPLRFEQVLVSEVRSYGAAGYHVGLHLGKYYSWLLLIGLLPRRSRLSVAVILTGPILTDYVRLKPRLTPFTFGAISLLENLVYQLGVVRGCLRERRLTALIPRFHFS